MNYQKFFITLLHGIFCFSTLPAYAIYKTTTDINGCTVTTAFDEKMSKIFDAIKQGDIDFIKNSIDQDCCNLKNDVTGLTGLMILAGICNQLAIVTELIQRGADINHKDENGNAPLLIAATNNPEFLSLLLKAGADVNAKNNKGRTPLMFAANLGPKDIVVKLLEAGADLTITDNQGATAIAYAMANYQEEIWKILEQHGANFNDGYKQAVIMCRSSDFKLRLRTRACS